MRTVAWDRPREILRIKDRIWEFLSPSAQFEPGVKLDGAALLQLSQGDLHHLAELHFLLEPAVQALDRDLPGLLRTLATTTVAEEERSAERIRGPIIWNKTLATRLTTGSRNMYVTEPARRAFQTPENEVLVAVLDAIVAAARGTGWTAATHGVAADVISRRDHAEEARRRRALGDVLRHPPTARTLARVRTGRHRRRYSSTLAAYQRWQELVQALNPALIQDVVEQRALVTRDNPTLFEIRGTFDVLDALKVTGWQLPPLRLFGSPRALTLTATRGAESLAVWYQHAPTGLSAGSTYRETLGLHGLSRSSLRPDLVMRYRNGTARRWVVCEMKLGTRRKVGASVRAALLDLLAYRRDFRTQLASQPGAYGLGLAWGSGLTPAAGSEVLLCTPDHVADALEILFGSTSIDGRP